MGGAVGDGRTPCRSSRPRPPRPTGTTSPPRARWPCRDIDVERPQRAGGSAVAHERLGGQVKDDLGLAPLGGAAATVGRSRMSPSVSPGPRSAPDSRHRLGSVGGARASPVTSAPAPCSHREPRALETGVPGDEHPSAAPKPVGHSPHLPGRLTPRPQALPGSSAPTRCPSAARSRRGDTRPSCAGGRQTLAGLRSHDGVVARRCSRRPRAPATKNPPLMRTASPAASPRTGDPVALEMPTHRSGPAGARPSWSRSARGPGGTRSTPSCRCQRRRRRR